MAGCIIDKWLLRNNVSEGEMVSIGPGRESFKVYGKHGSEHLGTLKKGNM